MPFHLNNLIKKELLPGLYRVVGVWPSRRRVLSYEILSLNPWVRGYCQVKKWDQVGMGRKKEETVGFGNMASFDELRFLVLSFDCHL